MFHEEALLPNTHLENLSEIPLESLKITEKVGTVNEFDTYRANFDKKTVNVTTLKTKADTEIDYLFGLRHCHLAELL